MFMVIIPVLGAFASILHWRFSSLRLPVSTQCVIQAACMVLKCSLIGHLGGAGGEDESGQGGQVSGSVQVVGQQSVTHDDVAA